VSENLQKLVGVVVMAVLVVVGVVVSSGDDTDFTRNAMLIPGIAHAGGDNAEVAELEMRLAHIEKLLKQIPELGVLADVIDRAEAGSVRVSQSVDAATSEAAAAVANARQAEQWALDTIAEVAQAWGGLDRPRTYYRVLQNAAATIAATSEDFQARITELNAELTRRVAAIHAELTIWINNANAQMTGVAPQFGPEFPGLGPMVDILCRTQLASWGTTAQWVSTGWDMRNEFWTCGYEQIQLEELNPPANIAFCLPGQEFSGGSPPGQGRGGPELFESIGRVGTSYQTDQGGRITFTDGVCRGGP
jgi:hypothetical protein